MKMDETRDQDIQRLLGEYVDRWNAGDKLDRQKVLAEHPDIGPALLAELETFLEFGKEANGDGDLGSLGDFRLLRRVGRGGMGVVYEALQRSLDRRVALKVLRGPFPGDQKAVLRFFREAKVAGKLQHSHIVPVFSMGIENGTPYYSMEFVEGETLEEVLERMRGKEDQPSPGGILNAISRISRSFAQGSTGDLGPRAPSTAPAAPDPVREAASPSPEKSLHSREIDLPYSIRVARAFAETAEGLQHAHSRGVIHRDLKPSNLILDREGRLRILDFGLACHEGQKSLTVSGEFIGTPLYMSPEQAMANRVLVDHRTDIYSLGATIYEMLTWRSPFRGRDYKETLSQIIARDPQPVRRIAPRVPRDLETIVLKCLRKDPQDRYATAEALSQDLHRFARGDPIEARPQPAWEKLARRTWRHRGKVAAAAAMIALLAIAGVMASRSERDLRLRREADYVQQVTGAVMKMLTGTLEGSAGMHRALRLDPYEYSFTESDIEAMTGKKSQAPVQAAVAELEAAAQSVPRRPDAHFHLARGYLLLGREADAFKEVRKALQCDPGFAPARLLWAEVLEKKADADGARKEREAAQAAGGGDWVEAWTEAHGALEAGNMGEAAKAYGKLIDLQSSGQVSYLGASMENLLGRGITRMGADDFSGAIEDFATAEHLWPGWIEPTRYKGVAYLKKREPETAEKIFVDLYERSPFKEEVILGIATAYSFPPQDYFEKGIDWLKKMKTDYIRERTLAVFLSNLGRMDEARVAAQKALQVKPDDLLSLENLIWIDFHDPKGDIREAEALSRKTVSLAPRDPFARQFLGEALQRQEKYKEALEEYRESIRINPRLGVAFSFAGECLQALGRTDEALAHLKQGVENDPLNPDPHQKLGFFHLGQGNYQASIQAFDGCLRIGARYSWPQRGKGEALLNLGKVEEAEKALQGACRGIPQDSPSYLLLATTLVDLGRIPEALAALGEGLKIFPRHTDMLERARSLLGRPDFKVPKEEMESFLNLLEKSLKGDAGDGQVLRTLVAAQARMSDRESLEKALRSAREEVQKTTRRDPDRLAALSSLEAKAGLGEEDIATLEEAILLPKGYVDDELASLRRSFLPDILTFRSIDAALEGAELEDLIPANAVFRYFPGVREPSPGLAWIEAGFDDSSWPSGPAPLGIGNMECRTVLPEMRTTVTTLYARHKFTVSDSKKYRRLLLSVRADDGYIAYLNGREVARTNAGEKGSVIPHNAVATAGSSGWPPIETLLDGVLIEGENILALQGLSWEKGRMGFFLSATLRGEPERPDREVLSRLRGAAKGDTAAERILYLEGKILQREGKHREAVSHFEEVLAHRKDRSEPWIHLVVCLRAVGDSEGALRKIEEGRAAAPHGGGELSSLKAAILLADKKLTLQEARAALGEDPASDARWLLDRLSADEAIRINCGGEEFKDALGNVWSRDCFFIGGRASVPGTTFIQGTADELLYQTGRTFPPHESSVSYAIPLLPGQYRVTLHFAEISSKLLGTRRFNVRIEGKEVLHDYEPLAEGPAKASVKIFEDLAVTDGLLEIALISETFLGAKVNAMEIQKAR